ncbi:MAG: hypothetical protein EPN88_13865 [Bacteroidetes bacterium]|nr:MAG: hypothetical protein EPN88_13865 [Bacteroidota bacterium]
MNTRTGFTTKMNEWKEETGYSNVDYVRYLEAALMTACEDRISDSKVSGYSVEELFYHYLYSCSAIKKYLEK